MLSYRFLYYRHNRRRTGNAGCECNCANQNVWHLFSNRCCRKFHHFDYADAACLELSTKLRLGAASSEEDDDSWRPIEESPWWGVGQWITEHNIAIATICLLVMAGIGYGMTRVESSVQLMRLFSPQARIRQDYRWLEKKLGPLVPMEILIRCDQEQCDLNFLERMELVDEIQREIGELGEVGSSLSTVTFGRSLDVGGGGLGGAAGRVFGLNARTRRSVLNRRLVAHRDEFLDGDYREAKVESNRNS